MAIVCHECGCINENDNARFCNDCGARLTPPETKSEPTGSLENPGKLVIKPVSAVKESTSQPVIMQEVAAEPKETVKPVQSEESTPLVRDSMPMETMVYTGQPVTVPEQQIREPEPYVEDDDEDEPLIPLMSDSAVPSYNNTDDGLFDDDEEEPPKSEPKRKDKKQKDISLQTDSKAIKEGDDSDPYYDDVLPEIDNEIQAIPKDIIFKVIGVILLAVVIALYMLSKLG